MNIKRVLGVLFAPIFTYIFILSGLTCSLLCLLLLFLWPFAKNVYRRVTSWLAYSIFSRKLFLVIMQLSRHTMGWMLGGCVYDSHFVCEHGDAEIVWISTEWAEVKVTLFGDDETYKNFGKESSLITLSHRGDLDWVAGYIMGVRFNFLHVSSHSTNNDPSLRNWHRPNVGT